MSLILYVAAFLVIMFLSAFNEKYLAPSSGKQDLAESFLFKDDHLFKKSLPFIWIPVKHVPNARCWLSWGGRTTNMVNQPYMNLAVKTVIDRCGGSFNVAIIDDITFEKILPGWSIDLSQVSEPHRSTLRNLALCKVLFRYGGLVIPPSFVCKRNLKDMFYRLAMTGKCIFGECRNKAFSDPPEFSHSSMDIMGCAKGCRHMQSIIRKVEILASSDTSGELVFDGTMNEIAANAVKQGDANRLEAEFLGVRDKEGRPVTLDALMSDEVIKFRDDCLGVLIPDDELLESIKYGWFVRMDIDQVLKSKTNIGRVLLTAACA